MTLIVVSRRRREQELAARERLHVRDPAPVQAARGAARRGALDPLPDRRECAPAVRSSVGDELRRREPATPSMPSSSSTACAGAGRGRPRRRRSPGAAASAPRAAGPTSAASVASAVSWNASAEPREPVDAELEGIDRALVRVVQRSGRVEILRALHLGLRRLDVAAELRVEVLLLQADGRQGRASSCPSCADAFPTARSRSCSSCSGRASGRRRSPRPRRRAARR